jgi:DNA-directed RNA polymerase subunit omega
MQYNCSGKPSYCHAFLVLFLVALSGNLMARVTVEDCLQNVDNLFQLVLLASQRARRLANGAEPTVPLENDKVTVLALREIAAGNITPEMLKEPEAREDSIVPDADNESTFRAPQFGLIDREL